MLIALAVTNPLKAESIHERSVDVKHQNRRLKILHNLSLGQDTNTPPTIPSLNIYHCYRNDLLERIKLTT